MFVSFSIAYLIFSQFDIRHHLNPINTETYIQRLGYNHLGTQFFQISKKSSVRHLFRTAQEVVAYGFPIKCLEATVLAAYLTCGLGEVDRMGTWAHRVVPLDLRVMMLSPRPAQH